MTPTRRAFLQTGGLVAWGLTAPAFLGRTARAAGEAGEPGVKDTLLVVVELTGGNDGLNTVVPFKDPEYARLRPTLRIAESDVKKLTDSIGLHPAMADLAKLH